MDPHEPKKLKDLLKQDLKGWQIRYAYLLEINHGLMGCFPALIAETGEEVIVLERPFLESVWKRLEARPAKVTSLLVVVHPESGVAFNLDSYEGEQTGPLRIIPKAEIERLCRLDNPFRWKPGTIGGSRYAHPPDFNP
jgi:hypothetical protein